MQGVASARTWTDVHAASSISVVEPGVFLDLVQHDQIAKVVRGIETAVAQSFIDERARQAIVLVGKAPTRDEVKRRGQICLRVFKELRGDLKWGVDRILDHLPYYLRCELDGVSWRPEDHTKRNVWSPTGT